MIDAIGWIGSALLVYSLLQTRVLRFRVLNLVAALVLVGFNAAVAVWPMVAVNAVIVGINAWHIVRLQSTRHDDEQYEVVSISRDEPYLDRLLSWHREDIARFNPEFSFTALPEQWVFLVVTGTETIGLVMAHRLGDDEAQVDLDYVLPRYRDFTPGEFVYRERGPFSTLGIRRVVAPRGMLHSGSYLHQVGFVPEGDDLVLNRR